MERKFAILGDIHANLEALNAVIEDARRRGVTDFVSVGDVVGYNASPSECIQLVRELGCVTVRVTMTTTVLITKALTTFSRWRPVSLHGHGAS